MIVSAAISDQLDIIDIDVTGSYDGCAKYFVI